MDEEAPITFETAVEFCAERFLDYSSETRVRALAYATSLCGNREVDPASVFKTIWSISEVIHTMVQERCDYIDDDPMMQANVEVSGAVMSMAWCHTIEPLFIKPVLCALAVEIQHVIGD